MAMLLFSRLCILLFFSFPPVLLAAKVPEPQIISPYNMAQYNQELTNVLKKVEDKTSMYDRIVEIGNQFLGKPYLLGALGEGFEGEYDQNPLYRSDAFDCLTYVSTVLALALSKDLQEYVVNHKKIQYVDGEAQYRLRNHFTNLDWNANNQKSKLIKDVTKTIHDHQGKSLAWFSRTYIDKKNWYRQKRLSSLKLLDPPSPEQAQILLKELRNEAESVENGFSDLRFIPLTALFDEKGKAQRFVFDQIPDIAVIEIIRPNWDLRKQIGTRLDISHLGFGIRKDGQLYFQHASETVGQVAQVPLEAYLKIFLTSPTIKGIAVYQVL